ncbi:MAG: hypothetical protein PVH03_04270 [Chloroflexota bacterium]|jgi:hypothetical protein
MLLALVMLAVGLYDQYTEWLGDYWLAWWAAFLLIMVLWVYFVVMMRRASIQVRDKFLRLQGPIVGYNISYGRIHSVTSGKMEQHFHFDELRKGEQAIIKPYYGLTCLFIELTSFPRSFRWRGLWFPRILFGTTRAGLICHVDDWMALSRDIESARSIRFANLDNRRREKTLAGEVLAEDVKFSGGILGRIR